MAYKPDLDTGALKTFEDENNSTQLLSSEDDSELNEPGTSSSLLISPVRYTRDAVRSSTISSSYQGPVLSHFQRNSAHFLVNLKPP